MRGSAPSFFPTLPRFLFTSSGTPGVFGEPAMLSAPVIRETKALYLRIPFSL